MLGGCNMQSVGTCALTTDNRIGCTSYLIMSAVSGGCLRITCLVTIAAATPVLAAFSRLVFTRHGSMYPSTTNESGALI